MRLRDNKLKMADAVWQDRRRLCACYIAIREKIKRTICQFTVKPEKYEVVVVEVAWQAQWHKQCQKRSQNSHHTESLYVWWQRQLEIQRYIVGANSTVPKKSLERQELVEILKAKQTQKSFAHLFPGIGFRHLGKSDLENLESFLNTNMDDVILEGKK